eukprot:656055-Amphidinium_carterae.1
MNVVRISARKALGKGARLRSFSPLEHRPEIRRLLRILIQYVSGNDDLTSDSLNGPFQGPWKNGFGKQRGHIRHALTGLDGRVLQPGGWSCGD